MNAKTRGLESLTAGLLGWGMAAWLFLQRPLDLGDEGYTYLLARSWARGEGLYSRFEMLYPPGEFLWIGTSMRLLGETLPAFRFGAASLVGLSVGVLWSVLSGRAGRLWAAGAALWVVALALPAGAFKTVGMVVVLAALLATITAPRRSVVLASAALAGVMLGWREDAAVLLGLVAAAGWWWERSSRLALEMGLAFATGFAFWLVPLGLSGEATAFLGHVVDRAVLLAVRFVDPARPAWVSPQEIRSLQQLANALLPVLTWVPPILYAGALLAWWRDRSSASARDLLAAGLFGMAFLPQFLWERPDLPHLLFHAPVFGVALTLVAKGWSPRLQRVTLAVLALTAGTWAFEAQRVAASGRAYPVGLGARLGVVLGNLPKWVGRIEAEGGTVIVLGWSPGIYLLEGNGPGTRYLSTFPRHLDDHDVAALAHDLHAATNRWVVLAYGPRPPALEAVLQGRYRLVASSSIGQLWGRLPDSVAASGPPGPAP